jgi:DNA modification methylase
MHTLHLGNCLDVLKTLPDNIIDAIVTDPPYGLAFMGKKWDYDVPSEDIWKECLRVLKPAGHLLAFAGTRTQHRMAVRIEDAGFEIRDMIAWVYGSGFPKSLNVSKAIDKLDASEAQQARRYRFTEWVRSTGLTSKQIDEATGTNMGGHYTTAASQPAIMTREHLEACRHLFKDIPEWVESECDIRSVESKNFAEREVVGKGTGAISTRKDLRNDKGTVWGANSSEFDITAPATLAAKQWQGWGTALKPALEPITVARKPFTGTVAANVLEYGTGAINVDGSRIPCESGQGRFPANLIHDGSEEAVLGMGESSRYFYCAKASKRDRDEGCEGISGRFAPTMGNGIGGKEHDPETATPKRNHHPTVKPTDLMRYLCRLVTPPNGTVLDPFMGSGSTGKAAVLEGFDFIGIEREAEYIDIARARIEHAINNKPNRLL